LVGIEEKCQTATEKEQEGQELGVGSVDKERLDYQN